MIPYFFWRKIKIEFVFTCMECHKKISLFWEHVTFHNLCLLQGLFKKMIYFFFYFLMSKHILTQNQKWRMIIRDNLTRLWVDQEMSKMPMFEWTRITMPLKRFRTLLTLGGPIIYELFWSLGNARLTAIIYACIWTWHITIVYTAWSNKFWTTEV